MKASQCKKRSSVSAASWSIFMRNPPLEKAASSAREIMQEASENPF
jgi:hypothetical protein